MCPSFKRPASKQNEHHLDESVGMDVCAIQKERALSEIRSSRQPRTDNVMAVAVEMSFSGILVGLKVISCREIQGAVNSKLISLLILNTFSLTQSLLSYNTKHYIPMTPSLLTPLIVSRRSNGA
jgi:hypothetical protein